MATQIQETMTGDSSGTQEVVAKVRDTVQEKAGDLRSHASERLRGEVDQRSARVGEQLSSIVEAMRKGADHLQGQGNGPGAKTAHNVADQAQRLAGYLSVTSADKLLADLEQGARKRPWLAGGLGLTAGVIASTVPEGFVGTTLSGLPRNVGTIAASGAAGHGQPGGIVMATNHVTEDLRNRGTGDLVKELATQISTLVRKEIELAKAEMAEKGKQAGLGIGMFGGAGLSGALTLGSLTALLILLFAIAIPAWAAALIVTALWAATTATLALMGRQKVQEMGKPVPEETLESVKEDVQWLKGRK